jgi:hypothetical protein
LDERQRGYAVTAQDGTGTAPRLRLPRLAPREKREGFTGPKIKYNFITSKGVDCVMQTVTKTVAKTARIAEREPVKLLKRIGSTVYSVNVRFSETATETLEDKILRMIESEVRKLA